MNIGDYLVTLAALVVLVAAIRYTYLQWRNTESQEAQVLVKILTRYAGERDQKDRLIIELNNEGMEMAEKVHRLEEKVKSLNKHLENCQDLLMKASGIEDSGPVE